jgi:hypothetical protein
MRLVKSDFIHKQLLNDCRFDERSEKKSFLICELVSTLHAQLLKSSKRQYVQNG